jgi:hypothetical protein
MGRNGYWRRSYDTFFRWPDMFLLYDGPADRMSYTYRRPSAAVVGGSCKYLKKKTKQEEKLKITCSRVQYLPLW